MLFVYLPMNKHILWFVSNIKSVFASQIGLTQSLNIHCTNADVPISAGDLDRSNIKN
jgi:hypothetical protein